MIFPFIPSNSPKSTSPYFYIGEIVAVYLSKMAAAMTGPIRYGLFVSWKWRRHLHFNIYLVLWKKWRENLGSLLSSSLCKVFEELMRSHWGVTEESLRRAWGGMRGHWGGSEVAMSSSFVFQHLRLWVKRVSHVGGPPYPFGHIGWGHIRSYGKSHQI